MRPSRRLRRAFLTLALVVCALVSWATHSEAHPLGRSSFSAHTDGPDINVMFILDGQSAADLVARLHLGFAEITPERVPEYGGVVLRYLDERFTISRGEARCERTVPTRFSHAPKINRVMLDVQYVCERETDLVEMHSTLFLDETTPHHVVGSLTHGPAVERYFFTSGERRARVDLNTLRKQRRDDLSNRADAPLDGAGGGVRVARPPPGAFTEAGAEITTPPRGDDSEFAAPIGTGFIAHFGLGIWHILSGFDHIVFVLSLLLVTARWKDLAIVITGFTVAHSITLALGALDLVTIPSAVAEPIIAASIIYVALENVIRGNPRARLPITFGFGLIHGFGFSSGLSADGLPPAELASSLLGFNLGVEAGQLAIVLPLFPALLWLQRTQARTYRRVTIGTSALFAAIASWWLFERLFA